MATPSILLLNVEQGPKEGCRLECKTGAITVVGRARASNLQISRDPGISQKHLFFEWIDDDDEENVGWTAMDAGSSNGTVINNVLVEPHTRVYIHTGDLIKIGSETSIRVEIPGVAVAAVMKTKERSKRKITYTASESLGKATPVVVGRLPRKAGRAVGKDLAAQACQGKQMNVIEGEEYHGKHKNDMVYETFHGKQHNNIFKEEGHLEQQDAMTGGVLPGSNHTNRAADETRGMQTGNMKTSRKCHRKYNTNNEAEEDKGNQRVYVAHQGNCAMHSSGNASKQDIESTPGEHVCNAKNVAAASMDIDLSMTVGQWFQHLMEEGPKYLYQASERIIQDVVAESKQFDEYVLSLS